MTNENNPQENNNTQSNKKFNKWRYIFFMFLLIILVFAELGLIIYGLWYGYTLKNQYDGEIQLLKQENKILKEERNIDVVELRKQNEDLQNRIKKLEEEKSALQEQLILAQNEIERLKPKNIRDFDYKKQIAINESRGDVWLKPIYEDITNDNVIDGIFAYREGADTARLNVYVYSYLDNQNTPTLILRAEGYPMGRIQYNVETRRLDIIYETGDATNPNVTKETYEYSKEQKQMIRVN
ncbi:MAG: hypothetical protein N3A71_02905 [Candidatus Dojkabacteria bacterium]|nr:hypothetical protein [Candidatus Dojkabacteria bacterium]